jgi:hypothetical protein
MEPDNTAGILVIIGMIIGTFFIKWGGENKKE